MKNSGLCLVFLLMGVLVTGCDTGGGGYSIVPVKFKFSDGSGGMASVQNGAAARSAAAAGVSFSGTGNVLGNVPNASATEVPDIASRSS
jgi:hypothetical protein